MDNIWIDFMLIDLSLTLVNFTWIGLIRFHSIRYH